MASTTSSSDSTSLCAWPSESVCITFTLMPANWSRGAQYLSKFFLDFLKEREKTYVGCWLQSSGLRCHVVFHHVVNVVITTKIITTVTTSYLRPNCLMTLHKLYMMMIQTSYIN
jgi:hypothetical protein